MNQDRILAVVAMIANTPLPREHIEIIEISAIPRLRKHVMEMGEEKCESTLSEHAEYYRRIWRVFVLGKKYGETSKLDELKRQGRLMGTN